jgi:AcrR family transcriptional regulator
VVGRREEKKEGTRRRLLDAASRVFAQRGFAAATLDEIAAAAGLTKGAVYSNFDGKADLAIAVLERRFDELIELFAHVDSTASLDEQFRLSGKLLVAELDHAVPWFQLELECTVAATRNSELLQRLRARGETMRATVAGALQEHFGDAADSALPAAAMASALIALVNGVALERLKDPATMPEDLVTRVIAAVKLSFLVPVS